MRNLLLPALLLSGCIDELAEDCDPDAELCGGEESAFIEDTWCWTLAPVSDEGRALLQVDLATGTWTEAYTFPGRFDGIAGMARVGDTLVMPANIGYPEPWLQLDLAAGTVTEGGPAFAESVATDGSRLLTQALSTRSIQYFDSFADLSADTPSQEIQGDYSFTRLAYADGLIYGAWHSDEAIDVHDATTGELARTIPLEDYDTWVWGISVAGGALHLIDDGRSRAYAGQGSRIAKFDLETGALLGDAFLGDVGWARGLWCEPY